MYTTFHIIRAGNTTHIQWKILRPVFHQYQMQTDEESNFVEEVYHCDCPWGG